MSTFLAAMRDGRWLTRERIRLWVLALLAASVIGFAFLVVTSDGLNDYQGRPLGTDFSNVYAAGTYVLDGKRRGAVRLAGAARARAGRFSATKTPFYGWHYPPYFLFIAGLLALMPYALALALWQAATLALYLGAVWLILRASAPKRCALKPRALDEPAVAAARARLPGGVRQHRPWPQRLSHRGADRRGAGDARPPADCRRTAVRPDGLQAAVRRDDPAGAGRDRTLARVRSRQR